MKRCAPRALVFTGVFLGSLAGIVDVAHAQCYGGPVSISFDSSARSQGLGGASSAVFWGGDPDEWANPALLGYHHGIHYRYFKTQFIPDFSDDIFFSETRITAGACGIGVSFGGLPGHLGGRRLDIGIEEFGTHERAESFGVGANVLELASAIGKGAAGIRRIRDWGDVSVGWARNEFHVKNVGSPAFASEGKTHSNDLGLLVRVRPLDTLQRPGPGPKLERLGGLQLDLALAFASRNQNDATITMSDLPQPMARERCTGVSARMATGMPPGWRSRLEEEGGVWLAESFAPLFALGVDWDHERRSIPGNGDRIDCSTSNYTGVEVAFANVVTLRWGYVDGRGIHGSGWGLGMGFSLADIAGIRYDNASAAQGEGISRRRDQGVSVFFDGLALARRVRERSSTGSNEPD